MASIAVDCDGVLADFIRAFFEVGNTIWPGRLDVNYQNKYWDDLQGLNKAEIKQVWDKIKATPNWWVSLNAYPDNVGAMAKFLLTNKHHDIYIVTSRVETAGQTVPRQTQTWLFYCGVLANVNYLGVVSCPDSDRKQDIYDAAGVQWSVDDKSETVMQCDKLPGHRAYLLSRPWNQDAAVKRRIPSLKEYFADITAAQGDLR